MSGQYVAAQSVALAKSQVGFVEGPNNRNPYSLWQYGNSYNPWCDSAVCYWAYHAGYRFPHYSACGEKGDYNVGTHHRNAIREGTWRNRNTRARPGWLIVLSWGIPDQHIEMVIADSGGSNIATIGGNTGSRVAYRTRYRSNVVGFIALDEAGQNAASAPQLPSQEIFQMGMTAASSIPGARAQTGGAWKGRKPFVGVVLQPNGTTDFVGFNGATLANQDPNSAKYGVSVVHLGKLNKPILELQPNTDKAGNYNGYVVGLASDGGTFMVKVSLKYL